MTQRALESINLKVAIIKMAQAACTHSMIARHLGVSHQYVGKVLREFQELPERFTGIEARCAGCNEKRYTPWLPATCPNCGAKVERLGVI